MKVAGLAAAAWGTAGVGAWLIVVYGIPNLLKAINGKLTWNPGKWGVPALIGFVLCYLVLGLVAPLVTDAHTP